MDRQKKSDKLSLKHNMHMHMHMHMHVHMHMHMPLAHAHAHAHTCWFVRSVNSLYLKKNRQFSAIARSQSGRPPRLWPQP
jgi:hypothetical protein